eukprot:tig00022075_g23640.t1
MAAMRESRYLILATTYAAPQLTAAQVAPAADSTAARAIRSEVAGMACEPPPKLKYDLSHLQQDTEFVVGPLQDDEALLLFGLVKTVRPKVVVEFGFFKGDSAVNWLRALDEDARLYSFDITPIPFQRPEYSDPRFKFKQKDQTKFDPADVDHRAVDLAFLDAGHTFNIQYMLWPRLLQVLAPDALVIVHDTGLHKHERLKEGACSCDLPNKCGFHHQACLHAYPRPRSPLSSIQKAYPEWQTVTLQSYNTYRHGATILQRRLHLSTAAVPVEMCTREHPRLVLDPAFGAGAKSAKSALADLDGASDEDGAAKHSASTATAAQQPQANAKEEEEEGDAAPPAPPHVPGLRMPPTLPHVQV